MTAPTTVSETDPVEEYRKREGMGIHHPWGAGIDDIPAELKRHGADSTCWAGRITAAINRADGFTSDDIRDSDTYDCIIDICDELTGGRRVPVVDEQGDAVLDHLCDEFGYCVRAVGPHGAAEALVRIVKRLKEILERG